MAKVMLRQNIKKKRKKQFRAGLRHHLSSKPLSPAWEPRPPCPSASQHYSMGLRGPKCVRAWLSGENKREEENREPSRGPGGIPLIPSAPGKGPASPSAAAPAHCAVLREASAVQDLGPGTGWAVPAGCRMATMLAVAGKRHSSTEESPVTAISPVLTSSPSIPSLVPGFWHRIHQHGCSHCTSRAGERRRFGRHDLAHTTLGVLREQLPTAGTAG